MCSPCEVTSVGLSAAADGQNATCADETTIQALEAFRDPLAFPAGLIPQPVHDIPPPMEDFFPDIAEELTVPATSFDDPIVPAATPGCDCYHAHQPAAPSWQLNLWRFANEVLTPPTQWGGNNTQPDYGLEYDIPVRAILEGWPAVEARVGKLPESWKKLQSLDEVLFNTCGQIGGHEGVGQIIAHGAGAKLPAIGSMVGIKWSASACLSCDNCLEGGETSCPSGSISGYFAPGTFQQYCVSPAIYVTPIPDGIDLAGAAPLMCGGVTVYMALRRANVQHGQWVVISGAGGGLGHLAIQYAKALGAKVLALDMGSKEKVCVGLGADVFVDFTMFEGDEMLAARVHEIASNRVKSVLVCSSSNRAYDQAVSFLGFRGTLACLGVPEGKPIPIAEAIVGDLIAKELTIFANKSGNRREAKECLEIAARGLVRTHYELRPMESLTDIFHDFENANINGRVVLDLR